MNPLDQLIYLHKTHRIASHILFWVGVLLVATLNDRYQSHEHWLPVSALSYYSLTLVTQIPTAYFLAYVIIPRLYSSRTYGPVIVYFLTGLYVICVLSRMLYIYVREPMVGISAHNSETFGEILTNIPKLFYIYFFQNFSIAIIFLFLKLVADQYHTQKRSLLVEKQKIETELKLLKAQLNPHFLFNTLNNIYSLSFVNASATSDSIARLADILDHILYRCSKPYVSLESEITLVGNYIELEKLRYDDRLHVSFTTHLDQTAAIAPLLLLTIVENAFKHGASNDLGSPSIVIDLQLTDGLMTFNVLNSVGPAYPNPTHQEMKPIGLANVKQQLQLLYENAHQLHIQQTNTLFSVSLQIDLNKRSPNHEKDPVLDR